MIGFWEVWVAEAERCRERWTENRRYMVFSQTVHSEQYAFAQHLRDDGDAVMCRIVQRYAAKKSHLCRARLGVERYEGD